jgi:D-glycero-D-manno-heptose 1,7-bisphosphate phosphatase
MLIILDRDGVINADSAEHIKSPEEWHAISGSLEAIAKLNRAGHTVVVATNQSGVARGYFNLQTLAAIHQKMQDELAKVGGHIDAIFFCPHGPDDNCDCRKPKPGLLWQIAKQFNTDFKDALVIGDSLRDIQAAQAVGCKAILVKTGKGANELATKPELKSVPSYKDLATVATEVFKLI